MVLFSRSAALAVVAPLMVGLSLLFFSGAAQAQATAKLVANQTACQNAAKASLCGSRRATTNTLPKRRLKMTRAGVGIKNTKTSRLSKKPLALAHHAKLRKRSISKTFTKHRTSLQKIALRAPTATAKLRSLRNRRNPHAIFTPTLPGTTGLRTSVAYVQDLNTSTVLFSKNEDTVRPIASISKLMTALVVLDANQPLDQLLQISEQDIDRLRRTTSRLPIGTKLKRSDMLHLALMASENRAAHALGRYYPGGMSEFVKAMNEKARELGMMHTHFVEPTGLSSDNVSSPRDLVRLLRAAGQRPLINRYTTDSKYSVDIGWGRLRTFRNTNTLVNNADWGITISKTGFINEAGKCLVMLARLEGREIAIVLLASRSKHSRLGDALRIRKLVQNDVAVL
jgi:D-alanyl-D-alanine endopeptidase (penicillin-binding protein 7)